MKFMWHHTKSAVVPEDTTYTGTEMVTEKLDGYSDLISAATDLVLGVFTFLCGISVVIAAVHLIRSMIQTFRSGIDEEL